MQAALDLKDEILELKRQRNALILAHNYQTGDIQDVADYVAREVLPHAPDAWIDEDKTRVGYEIPFNRHFYVFEPPRPLAVIDAELKQVTDRILTMIGGLAA